MTSIASTLQLPLVDRHRDTTRRCSGRLRRVIGSSAFWMLSDQAIASIGNFATINLLARNLPPAQYGGLGLTLETMLFLNSLQAGLVIYPLTLRGAATTEAGRLKRMATSALLFTVMLLPVLGAGMAFTALASGLSVATAMVGILAMLLGQLQETLRRGLIADRRIAQCVAGDSISYLGQALVISLLARAGHLSLIGAFLAIGLTSGAAALLQSFQIGLARVSRAELWQLAIEGWRVGRWMLLSGLTLLVTSLSFMWTLRWFHGIEAVATLLAVMMLMKLCNPIVSSIVSLVVPVVSRATDAGREPARGTRFALRYLALGGCLLVPYFSLLACFPTACLRIVFGADSPYVACAGLLRAAAINGAIAAAAAIACAWLCGLGRSRANFFVQAGQSAAVLAIGLPLTIFGGLPGLFLGARVGYLTQLLVAGGLILNLRPSTFRFRRGARILQQRPFSKP